MEKQPHIDPRFEPKALDRRFHGTHRIQVDPFFQVPLHTKALPWGDLQLPILVKDCSSVLAQFVAPRDKVESLLAHTPLEPVFVMGSRALVGVVLFKHRQSTVGAHLNFNLVIPVVRRTGFKRPSSWKEIRMAGDRRHMGFYITDSALDSPVMHAAGRDVWGYPKFMSQLHMKFQGHRLYGEANEADGRRGIVRLTGSGMRLARFRAVDLTMFTLKPAELLRSVVNIRGHFDLHYPFGFRLEVGDSEHTMAQRLRFLGLDNARPLIVMSSPDFQSRMNAGVVVDVLHSVRGAQNVSI